MDKRRDFLKKSGLLSLGLLAGQLNANSEEKIEKLEALASLEDTVFTLPALSYAADALEPFIDKTTMEIHHGKHHQAYVNNLNKALTGKSFSGSIESLLGNVSKHDATVRNNAGGHYNHSMFWNVMKPSGSANIVLTGKLNDAINSTFGNIDQFKTKFQEEAMKRFGSGWAWLLVDNENKLRIVSTPNQDNPLMDIAEVKGKPIICLDVWEHAYYLKYQNKRADYIQAWWNVLNWEQAMIEFNKL